MENPATWGEAEKTIRRAIVEHRQAWDDRDCRISQERRIADALRAAGLLLADPAALDDGQLDDYAGFLDLLMTQVVRENNRRAARKLLSRDAAGPHEHRPYEGELP